ncbi:MAG: FHIPEP family type III secretion protein [Candidatus Eremiobacter antarcticus]|nr:FHIPEP family type III secretion protein [Candidatus Eremiobacteraeota bacterium]MBC5807765.1 FHIPEP family type III secretion protein [Candidatus Eremiobacteraeota bacterium]
MNGLLALAVLASIAMLIIPLPPPLLDVLLAFDIMFATAVLVVALSIQNPLELAAFPSLLLVTTLFRLSLDVSATRLILTQGDIPGAVGSVIPAFGNFVMRGNAVVGLLLFVILIVVQLVVVTNGAQRVAEVAARFTLDAMPGKQMAIDADLHTGLIDATEARARRKAVQAEADFYGAMDGAGKFVRGDAIAAIVIVAVNIFAGMAIGIFAKHLDLGAAAHVFSLLSIGNALATTLPAFLLSTAMGIMVTRAASDNTLGSDLLRQLLAHPAALRTVGVAMLLLACVPGLPHVAFGLLGTVTIVSSTVGLRAKRRAESEHADAEANRKRSDLHKPEQAITLLAMDALSIGLGEELLPLLEHSAGSVLLHRIALLRRVLALELGILMPGVRVQDDMLLPARGFAIKLRDRVVAHGKLHADRSLAIGPPTALSQLPGEAVAEPAHGASAVWLPQSHPGPPHIGSLGSASEAVVVDPIAVLISTLAAVVRANVAALLGRQEVQMLLDNLKQTHPAAVKGVVPEVVSLGLVQRVLQHIVRERVSIRDIAAIVETIADEAETTRDPSIIGEAVRRRLAPAICAMLADKRNIIKAAALTPELESQLAAATAFSERGPILGIEPALARVLAPKFQSVSRALGSRAAVVCSQSLRLALSRFLEACGTSIAVLGLAEVAAGYAIDVWGTIGLD